MSTLTDAELRELRKKHCYQSSVGLVIAELLAARDALEKYEACLTHISIPGRCPNPVQCAQEALIPEVPNLLTPEPE